MKNGMLSMRAGPLLVLGGVTLGMGWTSGAGATTLWNGNSDSNWFNSANWGWDSIVPLASTTASIQTATGNTPVIAFGLTGVADLLVVGGGANGLLTIDGTLNSNTGLLGNNSGTPTTTGTVNVSGAWTNSGNLHVGNYSVGQLNINGGSVSAADAYIGAESTASGTITLTGSGSSLTTSGVLYVGQAGTGTLNVNAGTTVTTAGAEMGSLAGSSGTATVDGGTWNDAAGNLTVGAAGTGDLTVKNGGTLTSITGVIGAAASSSGSKVSITGTGSTWTNSGALFVGTRGNGSTLDVLSGGKVYSTDGVVARYAGASGTVNVNGSGSLWSLSGNLRVGGDSSDTANPGGNGTLNIGTGGTVSNANAYIGDSAGATGSVTVDGGTWTNTGNLGVGYSGTGTLLVENGGTVSSVKGFIGWQNTSLGSTATVTGSGSSWVMSDTLYVGNSGKGAMTVADGGYVSSLNGYVGTQYLAGQTSTMEVTGSGSIWNVTNDIVAGYDTNASGSISITDGAIVTAGGQGMLGHTAGSTGAATVDNATWNVTGDFNVGWHGTGNLTIQNGGTLTSNRSYIGNETDGSGSATVTGSGSSWTTTGNLYVGAGGSGTLTVADSATVTANSIRIAYYDGTTGTLNVGAAEGSAAVAAGSLVTNSISFGAGLDAGESSSGTLVFNHTDSGLAVSSVISGAGTVKVLGGTTIFTGANTYSSGTVIGSGATLQVGNGGTSGSIAGNVTDNGALIFNRSDNLSFAGDISGTGSLTKKGAATLTLSGAVDNGGLTDVSAGTLALTGSFSGGAINVASGSTLSLADGLTANLHGNYNQSAGATLQLGASSASSYGKLVVSGTANLAGNLYVDVASSNLLTTSHNLSSIIHATSINGTFASVSDNSTLFDFTASYTGTDVDLIIASSGKVYQSVVATGNNPATGAARALDKILGANPTGAIASAFLGITGGDQAVSNAVSQTLPLLTGSSQLVASAALSSINQVVQARLESNQGLSSGDAFLGDRKFWMKPFGSWADQDDRKGVPGYTAKTGGLALGADAAISDSTRLGLSLAYARADVTGNSSLARNNDAIDVYRLIGYGSYLLDQDTELNFQAGIGQNKNDGDRQIVFAGSTAKANYDSLTATAGLGLGRTYRLSERTSIVPSLRADYTWIKDDAYTETGAGALNLKVQQNSTEQLLFTFGGKLAHEIAKGTTATANLGVGYDVLNDQTSITAAYAGAPATAFTTRGLDPSPWLLKAGLGIVKTTVSGMEIAARYDAEQRTGFLNQTASVKLRWAF